MNKLYGLLTYSLGTIDSSAYYFKAHSPVSHTWRSKELTDALLKYVPDNKLPMFACFVCWAVTQTEFSKDILGLDSENTYHEFSRPATASPDDPMYRMESLTGTSEDMHSIAVTLDKDITDRLSEPTWLDTAAAVCLQILREAC